MTDQGSPAGGTVEPSRRVSTLELFFDLVFVFTITQVAFIVEHEPNWHSVGKAALVLLLVYWMYGGYAWLTNAIGGDTPRARALLLAGMAAFFVVSLAVPGAFDEDATVFAIAYLVLTVIHLLGFLTSGVPTLARAMLRVGAINGSAAVLVLIAVGVHGWPRWVLWLAALAIQWALPMLREWSGGVNADHFAERHGLMIIIVLGESLVSVALAAHEVPLDAKLVVGALCGLALSMALWWMYFGGDDEAAAAGLRRIPLARRGPHALYGYDLTHIVMIGGVAGVAAGTRLSLEHLTEPAELNSAALIAGGVAVYLTALAAFRRSLGHGRAWLRVLTAALSIAAIVVGREISTAAELGALALLLAVLAVAESRWAPPTASAS